MKTQVDIAVVGAGIVGIACAYSLALSERRPTVALIDPLAPMSLTSAASGENYRNWWPHPVMTAFTDYSIDLMETALPGRLSHYGGYYTMTRENWPLIGPMATKGAFVAGALSGYGTMGACATGALCAAWILGETLPDFARSLSLARYGDKALMQDLLAATNTGVL